MAGDGLRSRREPSTMPPGERARGREEEGGAGWGGRRGQAGGVGAPSLQSTYGCKPSAKASGPPVTTIPRPPPVQRQWEGAGRAGGVGRARGGGLGWEGARPASARRHASPGKQPRTQHGGAAAAARTPGGAPHALRGEGWISGVPGRPPRAPTRACAAADSARTGMRGPSPPPKSAAPRGVQPGPTRTPHPAPPPAAALTSDAPPRPRGPGREAEPRE